MFTRLLALCLCLLATSGAQAEQSFTSDLYDIKVVTVADDLESPWGMAFLPDGRLLVTEQPGRLRVVDPAGAVSPPVEGLPQIWARGQGGLLDVVLDPDYATTQLIYFSYSEPGPNGSGTAVARARFDSAANRLTDVKVLFRQSPKSSGGRHFGSRLVFGPEGHLFITTGDRGERNRNQDATINRGQVIRIHPDGRIPTDNPFVGKDGFRPEVWSWGHRNPQGAARHPETGKLWVHEHGARGGDEINIPEAGKNYGWPVISYGRHYSGFKIGEGTAKPGMEQPIHYWDPSIAPSGMAFYTGNQFPEWRGNLFVGALRGRMLVRLTLDGERVVKEERLLEDLGERIRDVRNGPDGALYLLIDADPGQVLRLVPR